MPDKAGWRHKIQHRPSQKLADEPPAADEASAGPASRKPAWKRGTSETTISTMPALSRYLSGYQLIKDAFKEPAWSEPWNDFNPLPYVPPIDSTVIMQSIFSYINSNPSTPIPPSYNSGILRLFEDYRKIRDENEQLDDYVSETMHIYERSEKEWIRELEDHQTEIHRLELVIAHQGTTGVANQMRARQNSIVQRSRPTNDKPIKRAGQVGHDIEEEADPSKKGAHWRRSLSPSNQMVVLSQTFLANGKDDILAGPRPQLNQKMTLSQKVKSELNLMKLMHRETGNTKTNTIEETHGTKSASKRSSLSEEAIVSEPGSQSRGEMEAIEKLGRLGTIVAGYRGLNADKFVTGLMHLLAAKEQDDEVTATQLDQTENVTPKSTAVAAMTSDNAVEPSQVRRFSFEPGEDHLREGRADFALEEKVCISSSNSSFDLSLAPAGPLTTTRKRSKIASPIDRPASIQTVQKVRLGEMK